MMARPKARVWRPALLAPVLLMIVTVALAQVSVWCPDGFRVTNPDFRKNPCVKSNS